MKQRQLRSCGVFFAFLALFLFSFMGISWAQSNTSKIKDASIVGTPVTALKGVLLELESISKGFLAPRLTTTQRDAIPADSRPDGLLIYNLTTGCFNHWSESQLAWLSICGTPPPAELRIVDCVQVKAEGVYTQGKSLTSANFITMPVVVTQAGNYFVSATSNNGYYFEKSGNFPAPGNYTLNIPGMGTPQSAPAAGDVLEFSFNGLKDPNCQLLIPVIAASVDFALQCSQITVEGQYNIGVPLGSTHKMKVDITMTSPGYWSINTGTELNGIRFSGSGSYDVAGTYTVELQGMGKPLSDGTFNYILNSNSSTPTTCTQAIVVSPVSYTMDCSSANFQGLYTHNVALDASNTLTLPVNVTATGSTTITSSTVNGMSFSSGPITFSSLGVQDVVLNGTGKPTTAGAANFSFTGTPGAAATCSKTLNVMSQGVNFSLNCSSISILGEYAPEMAMTAENKIKLSVDVTYLGAYTISTNTENGISFSASGTFTALGPQEVVLMASGTSLNSGNFNYTLNSNSAGGIKSCVQSIKFVYRKMNVLGLGYYVYQPGTADDNTSARAILTSALNFSPNGKVPTQGFNIIDGGVPYDVNLKGLINNNKIDIIILGYYYKPSAVGIAVLADFVKNKKGVLLHSEQGDGTYIQNLINNLSGGNVTVTGVGTTVLNPIAAIPDPTLVGPFGDASGKYFGNDVNNANYVTNTPATMTALAFQNGDPSRAAIIKHNTLGYIFYGESGWIAGNKTDARLQDFPCKIGEGGVPIPKPFYNNTDVYNSIVYANTMTWAIKYVQNNTDVNYVLP